jgi:CheY-like chemotaxis protein
VGLGSVFRVLLPLARDGDGVAPAAAAAPPAFRLPPSFRLLVVDDEPMVGAAVARALGDEVEVVISTSGKEALDRILTGERFDRVLCDVMMPGMSGAELLTEVERRAPRLRGAFVFMTGGAFTEGAVRFLQGHGGPLLEKPLDLAALRRVLHDGAS